MLKARESVFWPGISDDIHEAVKKCGICQSTSRAAKSVGNISKVPPYAWHSLGNDLFYWNRMDFLDCKENSKYLHTHGDQGTGNDLHRIWTSIHTQRVTMAHVTVPGSSTTSCNSTRFTTSQAAHITHKAIDLLKLWWGF